MSLLLEWYGTLSQLYAAVADPLIGLVRSTGLPPVAALLLGLLAAFSPCQLTTNAGAIAWVAREAASGRRAVASAAAFILGKAAVYMLLGVGVALVGRGLETAAIPVFVTARKALGPLMILVGFAFLGLISWRPGFGRRLAASLKARLPRQGVSGAFGLGVAFAFAFCPTLALLFFSLLLPLTLATRGGFVLPALFAVGTALPLIGFTALLLAGGRLAERYTSRAGALDGPVRAVAGAVFLLAGINDTLLYWALG
jgi:cytochrome c-type biogenesis protein